LPRPLAVSKCANYVPETAGIYGQAFTFGLVGFRPDFKPNLATLVSRAERNYDDDSLLGPEPLSAPPRDPCPCCPDS